jgi:hypothetical protein
MMQVKTQIPQELQDKIYKRFTELPFSSSLVVYARLVHGNMFKAQNGDLFGLNRRLVSKIYRAFIESLKKDFNASHISFTDIPDNE